MWLSKPSLVSVARFLLNWLVNTPNSISKLARFPVPHCPVH